jgi:hypothetical protein
MKPRMYLRKMKPLLEVHKDRIMELLGIPYDNHIVLNMDKKRRGDKHPTGYYQKGFIDTWHDITFLVLNIRDRPIAKFEGDLEEKLLYTLAHEMTHLKQRIEGRFLEVSLIKAKGYQDYLKMEDTYMEQPHEQEANAFACSYLEKLRAAGGVKIPEIKRVKVKRLEDKIREMNRGNVSRTRTTNENLLFWWEGDNDQPFQATFEEVKQNVIETLSSAPKKIVGLLRNLREGKIEGDDMDWRKFKMVYTSETLTITLTQLWFRMISEGDTPDNDWAVRLTIDWITEWQASKINVGGH